MARATRWVTLSPGRKVTAPPRLHMYPKAANGRSVILRGDVACRPAGILGGEVQLEDRNNHIRPGRLPKLYRLEHATEFAEVVCKTSREQKG